jgi:hypothetical protein
MKQLLVVCCALILTGAAFPTVRAGAQPAIMVASPQFVTFGMVGLNTGQTARLNAFALPLGGPLIAGASCQVTFDFYDATGKTVKTGTATVAQGNAVSLDLARSEIATTTTTATATPGRVEIRGAVRAAFVSPSAVGTPVTPVAPGTPVTPIMPISAFCSVLPTLEIFDSSGQTTVVLQQPTALPLVIPQ